MKLNEGQNFQVQLDSKKGWKKTRFFLLEVTLMDLDQRQVTCIFKLVCKDLETILQEAMAV